MPSLAATLPVVTLGVVGILDVSGSLLGFWLLMFLGFVELVVDAVVGPLVVTRGVLLAASIVFFWAEVDTALVTDVLDMGTPVSAVVAVEIAVDVPLDVGVAFCVTVVGGVAFRDSFWELTLELTLVVPLVFPVAFPLPKSGSSSKNAENTSAERIVS